MEAYPLSFLIFYLCFTKHTLKISPVIGMFRPEEPLSAENTIPAVITVLAVLRHFTAHSYGFSVSAKNLFRSHTNYTVLCKWKT